MHSIIICGGTKKDREEYLKSFLPKNFTLNHPDVKILGPTSLKHSIGIDEVRLVERFLIKKPLKSKENIVIIENANLLTLQAQNAILKTLEEPPKNSKIILETQNEKKLLPTILSRCKVTKLKGRVILDESDPAHNLLVKEFVDIIKKTKGDRLDYIDNIKQKLSDKDFSINLINIWQSVLRDCLLLNLNYKAFLLNKQNQNQIKEIKLDITKSIEFIDYADKLKKGVGTTSVSPRLTLELLLLKL